MRSHANTSQEANIKPTNAAASKQQKGILSVNIVMRKRENAMEREREGKGKKKIEWRAQLGGEGNNMTGLFIIPVTFLMLLLVMRITFLSLHPRVAITQSLYNINQSVARLMVFDVASTTLCGLAVNPTY